MRLYPFPASCRSDFATCAIDSSRRVTCWGSAGYSVYSYGQDFRGDTVAVLDDSYVCASSGRTVTCLAIGFNDEYEFPGATTPFLQLAVASTHVCAVDASSKLHCKPRASYTFAVPSRVMLSHVRTVAVASYSTCVIFRTAEYMNEPGEIFCWGGGIDSFVNDYFQQAQAEHGAFHALTMAAGDVCGVSASGVISCPYAATSPPAIASSLRIGAHSCMLSIASPSSTASESPSHSPAPFVGKCPGNKPNCHRMRASRSPTGDSGWRFVGAYEMAQAPAVQSNTLQRSCEQTCREQFREVSTGARVTCSTNSETVNFRAWVNRFGSHECHVADATAGSEGGLFNQIWWSLSAFVLDAPDCMGKVNYCFTKA